MNIFKSIMIVSLSLIMISTIHAQRGTERALKKDKLSKMTLEERVEKQNNKLVKKLDLSEAQAAQIKAIHLEQAKSKQVEIEARQLESEKVQAQVRSMLTEEQAVIFDEKLAKKGKKNKRGKGMKNTDRLIKKLDLSDSQAEEIKAIYHKQAKSYEAEQEARDLIKTQNQAEIRSILTEEQAVKYDQQIAKKAEKQAKKMAKRKAKKKDTKIDELEKK